MTDSPAVPWDACAAVLFDLDGVVTPTAEVHMRAWAEMFDEFLSSWDGPGDTSPYVDTDYFAFVDGKPRYDGVRDFLASRGISLPESGAPVSVEGLGDLKNDAFNAVLERDGVTPYPGTVLLLDHLRALGTPLAIVSSSANAPAVLLAAGVADRFTVVVDGRVAREQQLPGKPAPDTFQHAADLLGVPRERCVVVEDAVSGVRAGAAGGFLLVVGVDRGAGHEVLAAAGADTVVSDLEELLPPSAAGARR